MLLFAGPATLPVLNAATFVVSALLRLTSGARPDRARRPATRRSATLAQGFALSSATRSPGP